LKTIVLDPGHGGDDPGVIAGSAVEKDLALALARLLRPELERRLGARVLLTRDQDRDLSAEARAEFANRIHADLVLSLHFDGFPDARARGATGYCAPATFAAGTGRAELNDRAAPIVLPPCARGSGTRSRAARSRKPVPAINERPGSDARLRERLRSRCSA
jgi:N-acetylmuramoyl-L-alanine amidase